MAPELIDPNDDEDDDYPVTCQTDVYSFGMTVLEVRLSFRRRLPETNPCSPDLQILTGRPPFSHRHHDTSVICDIFYGRRPLRPTNPDMTDSIWALIQSCWHQDPAQRIDINGVGFWLTLLSQTHALQPNVVEV